MNFIKFIFLGLAIFLSIFSFAQKEESEEIYIYLPITSISKKADSLFATINYGKNIGIKNDITGRTVNVFKADINNDYKEAGTCKVVSVNEKTSKIYIELFNTGSAADSIYAGDIVALSLSVPRKEHTIFFDLAVLGIDFIDAYIKPLYTLDHILFNDSKAMEDSILANIVADVKETYEMVYDFYDDTSYLNQPLKEGRYKGKSVLETMRDVTASDVRSYLLFIKSYPFRSMGHRSKISYVFADWVLGTAYTSPDEIKELMLAGEAGKARLKKIYSTYKTEILEYKVLDAINETAITLSNKERIVDAHKILEAVKEVVFLWNDTLGKASNSFSKAQVFQNERKYNEAIKAFDESIKFSLLAGDIDIELQSRIKKAVSQYEISAYKDGLLGLQEVEKKLKIYSKKLPASVYLQRIENLNYYNGLIKYSLGEYEAAVKDLRMAINHNEQINSYDSKFKKAYLYWYMGKAYSKQANYQQALNVLDSSYTIYNHLGDSTSTAIINNEAGHTLYSIGNYEKSLKKHQDAYTVLLANNSLNTAGYSQSMIGQNLWMLGKYNEAIAAHQLSIDLRKKSDDSEGQAFSWSQLAELYLLSGEKTKSLLSYDSAAHYYALIKDSSSIAKNYIQKGKVYENDSDTATALLNYEKGLQIARKNNRAIQVEALFTLGYILFNSDSVKAKKYFEECLFISKQIGDKTNQLYSLVNLGALAGNNYDNADEMYYQQALDVSKEINTPAMEAYCYNRMAEGYQRKLNFDKALLYSVKASGLYDSVDKKEYIRQLLFAANVYISKGDFDKAEENYVSAINIASATNNKLEWADALGAVSYLYRLQGEFLKGMAATDSAAYIYKETGNNMKLAGAYESWANLYTGLGNYKKAIESYLVADSIYAVEKQELYRDNVLFSMAVTYFFQADYKKSLELFQTIEAKLRKGVFDESFILTKSNIAECLYYLKKIEEAQKILNQVYPIAKEKNVNRIASSMAIILGRIHHDKNNLKEASDYLQMAKEYGIKSGEKEKIVEAMMYLGKVETALNKTKEAGDNLREAAAIARKYNLSGYTWEALYELGLFYYNNDKLDSAVTAFKDAVDLIDKQSQNIYGGEEAKKLFQSSEKKVDLYKKLVASLAKSGKTADAWAYANKSNITAIKELQGSVSLNGADADKNAAISHANTLLQQQAALDKSINDATQAGQKQSLHEKKAIIEKEYLNYINSLIEKYPDLELYFARNVNPEQFKNYKDKLPKDAAALLYLINDDQLLVFTVTNEKIGIKIFEVKEDLNKTVTDFINVLDVPASPTGTAPLTLRSNIKKTKGSSGGSFIEVSERLYNLLIDGVADEIKGKKKLCIIPNGRLSNIPFQCLGKRGEDSTFRFLMEDYSIFYTNTLDIFKNEVPGAKAMASFAAFGNPDKTLVNAKKEVVEIGKLLNLSNVYVDDFATEQKAKQGLSEKKYVHFATHGILDHSDFSNSYLTFAVDKTSDDDGKLTLKEIKELDIAGCDLVTLSACQTAVSQEVKKGWYVSPANSLLMNRVKSVVASLWNVDDEATGLLMQEFYKNIRTMDKVDALRKAQETLSRNPKYVHPCYWGAFVLYGEWR